MLNICCVDSCVKVTVGNKTVRTGIIVLSQISFIEMSSYRTYRASSPIILSTETNLMHTILSSIKIDQLDFTCFIISLFTAQHVSNVSTSIFRSLRLIVNLFHVLYWSGSLCRLQPA